MTTFHHTLMQDLDAAQMSGAMGYLEHRAMRQALRDANMQGKAVASMIELREFVRLAGRDRKGRFCN